MEDDIFFVEKVKEIIQNNIENTNLNGVLIAQKLNMSRMQLYRKLKQTVSQSATDYINILRTEYAKKELLNTSKFTYQIAKACGFRHYTYFSKVFKKHTGYSPTEYRREHLE